MKKIILLCIAMLLSGCINYNVYNLRFDDKEQPYRPFPYTMKKMFLKPHEIQHYNLENSLDYVYLGQVNAIVDGKYEVLISTELGFFNFRKHETYFLLEEGYGKYLLFVGKNKYGFVCILTRKDTNTLGNCGNCKNRFLRLHNTSYKNI